MITLEQAKVCAFVATVNADAAKGFYGDILGLKLVEDSEYALVYDSNGTMLRVQRVRELAPHPFTSLGWNVNDIRGTIATLNSRGVSMARYEFIEQDALGVWTTPDGTQIAWFNDPDGNVLSLAQFRTP